MMFSAILSTLRKINSLLGRVAALIIRLYQATLSPDHGFLLKARYPHGYCSFYPSCSEYSKQAFTRRGFIVGLIMSVIRVSKCYPGRKPTIDPVKIN